MAVVDWLAGDQSEGVLSPEEFGRVLDRVLERWEPEGDELAELEQLIDRDESAGACESCGGTGYHTFDPPVGDHAANQTEVCPDCGGHGHGGLFSPDGRQAIRAAIQRRRES